MGDPVKSISDHVEDLADGRQVAPGEISYNVDLSEPHNQRLIKEGRLLKLTKKEAEAHESEEEPPAELPPPPGDGDNNNEGGDK